MRPFVVAFLFFVLVLNYVTCMETPIAERVITFAPSYNEPGKCMTHFLDSSYYYVNDIIHEFRDDVPPNLNKLQKTISFIREAYPHGIPDSSFNEALATSWDQLFSGGIDYAALQNELESKGMTNNLTWFLEAIKECKNFIVKAIALREGAPFPDVAEPSAAITNILRPAHTSGYSHNSPLVGKKVEISLTASPIEDNKAEATTGAQATSEAQATTEAQATSEAQATTEAQATSEAQANTEAQTEVAESKGREKKEALVVKKEQPQEEVILRNPKPWIDYIMETLFVAYPSATFTDEEADADEKANSCIVKVATLRHRQHSGVGSQFVKFSSAKDRKSAAAMAKFMRSLKANGSVNSFYVSLLKDLVWLQELAKAAIAEERRDAARERFEADLAKNGLPLKPYTKASIASAYKDSVRAEKILAIVTNFAMKEFKCEAPQFDSYMATRLQDARRLLEGLRETKRENQDNLDTFKAGLENTKSSKDDWQVIADRNAEIALRYELANNALKQRRGKMSFVTPEIRRKVRIGIAKFAAEKDSIIQRPSPSARNTSNNSSPTATDSQTSAKVGENVVSTPKTPSPQTKNSPQ